MTYGFAGERQDPPAEPSEVRKSYCYSSTARSTSSTGKFRTVNVAGT